MKVVYKIRRLLAPDAIYRQLYPPPGLAIKFRRYEARDRARILEIHDSNAPNHFPANHRPVFEKFLDTECVSFFVGETDAAKIVACCGVTAIGQFVNVLHYGLVAPEYQRLGIGSAMTLARLAFATREAGNSFSFIYALEKSMSYYERLGYAEVYKWKDDEGIEYPVGLLSYHSTVIERMAGVLSRRGHRIDPSLKLDQDSSREAVIDRVGGGIVQVRLQPVSRASSK